MPKKDKKQDKSRHSDSSDSLSGWFLTDSHALPGSASYRIHALLEYPDSGHSPCRERCYFYKLERACHACGAEEEWCPGINKLVRAEAGGKDPLVAAQYLDPGEPICSCFSFILDSDC